jgi:hypothetical protein
MLIVVLGYPNFAGRESICGLMGKLVHLAAAYYFRVLFVSAFVRLVLPLVAAGCTSLSKLDVRTCDKLAGELNEVAAAGCASLVLIVVLGCPNFTGRESISGLMGKLVHLAAAYFSTVLFVSAFVRPALPLVAAGCTSLTSLDVRTCDKVAGEFMKVAVAGCASFMPIIVLGCPNFTGRESTSGLMGKLVHLAAAYFPMILFVWTIMMIVCPLALGHWPSIDELHFDYSELHLLMIV